MDVRGAGRVLYGGSHSYEGMGVCPDIGQDLSQYCRGGHLGEDCVLTSWCDRCVKASGWDEEKTEVFECSALEDQRSAPHSRTPHSSAVLALPEAKARSCRAS